ncbi:MAG: ABC transporter permease subunit [Pseudomonadota bacterium]
MLSAIDPSKRIWIALIAITLAMLALRESAGWLITYPSDWVLPIKDWLNGFMAWFEATFGWFFKGITAILEAPLGAVQVILQWLPWPVTIALCAVAAHAAAGWRLVAFTVAAMFYMVLVGYWSESMNTLSLVAISVPLAILIGFVTGIIGYYFPRSERAILTLLDLLQTVPAFAYLIPIITLFGFGPVVGLIASLIYAFPPMVRNTMLGLRRVPAEVIESGLMSGATGWQLFWQVQIPTAARQLLLGVNQTTMAALSMVIIASIIGGTADIGWEVISKVRKAEFGESLLAGIVIALMAMVMDRISAGLALKDSSELDYSKSFAERHKHWIAAAAIGLALLIAAQVVPFLKAYPEAWEFYPAQVMNDALETFVVDYRTAIEAVKNFSFFFIMLPARIGLEQTISPFSWGFEFTPMLKVCYLIAMAGLVAFNWMKGRHNLALVIAFFAILMYFGLTKLPWAALIALTTYLAWTVGGRNLAAGVCAALVFLLVAGVWPQAMLSVYLCGLAVAISFLLGGALGIWAAKRDRVSAVLRPINDTMQTMPLFVILIPFVMIFKIGEFTALLAIIAYAFVPAIRYTEHGLRNLPADVLEAADCMGCTKWQLLWQVKLPLALPVIMLGLNQTILYGIAMLVIAALVGTNGLGQQVYIGLGDGDFGVGIIAGIGMAIIAMTTDRLIQAWSKSRQEAFGLTA